MQDYPLEQVKLRLSTVSELGDLVVTLSPCMSIIKGLAPSLNGLMPEVNNSMQDMSQSTGRCNVRIISRNDMITLVHLQKLIQIHLQF